MNYEYLTYLRLGQRYSKGLSSRNYYLRNIKKSGMFSPHSYLPMRLWNFFIIQQPQSLSFHSLRSYMINMVMMILSLLFPTISEKKRDSTFMLRFFLNRIENATRTTNLVRIFLLITSRQFFLLSSTYNKLLWY